MPASVIAQLRQIVGDAHVIDQPADMAGALSEPRGLYHGAASCVVRPANTAEVSAILALCNATQTPVIPQGGNTGLVGGQVPLAGGKGNEVILSLTRLDRIREIDISSSIMVAEAGVTLANVQAAAENVDRLFPLSLASEGTCTIGGNLATNAGGTAVIAYGNTRDLVSGLEVVLADGRILPLLSRLRKDNTGYDLKHLFMGSEGTLGVITAVSLRLFARPRSVETAFIGLASPQKALDLLHLAREQAGGAIRTFELMPRIGLDFVLRHATGARDPLDTPHDWYVLAELASETQDSGLAETMAALLAQALEEDIIQDAALAASSAQRDAFWALRENLSEMQKFEGGSIKHDISVPIASVPEFLEAVTRAVTDRIPGARMVPFGHLGDGNIHCNVSQPVGADKQAFLARWVEINALVHGIVTDFGGSISAEHGIGQLKRDLLPGVKDPVALSVMRSIKQVLDPTGIMNPGKVL